MSFLSHRVHHTSFQWNRDPDNNTQVEKSSDTWNVESSPPLNNNHIHLNNSSDDIFVSSEPPPNESAIDCEIRLAQEREDELKRAQEIAVKQAQEKHEREREAMPIRKVPPPTRAGSTSQQWEKTSTPGKVIITTSNQPVKVTTSSQPAKVVVSRKVSPNKEVFSDDVPESERYAESIIDREIREQQEREQALLKEGKLTNSAYIQVRTTP